MLQKPKIPPCVLNESFFPESWKLDSTMSLYFDEFKPCRLNWDHNHQKMTFWKELIEGFCFHKGSAKFNIGELKQAFKRKGIYPRCLQTVVNQMKIDGHVVEKEDFFRSPQTLVSWAITLLFVRPLFWAAENIRSRFISNNHDELKTFVVKSVVNRQSQILLEFLRNNYASNEVIAMEQLEEEIARIKIISKDGLGIVLQDLRTSQLVQVDEIPDQERQKMLMIKVCASSETFKAFTELERTVCKLQRMEKLLLKSLCDKENESNATLQQVRACIQDGKKQTAKSLLRKKHLLEADLKRIESALGNIQTVLHQVNASASDHKIFETYKFVSKALKANFAKTGMSVEQVHGIIDNVKEIYDQHEEISDVMANSFDNTDDDFQLENELMELMKSDGKGDSVRNEPEKPSVNETKAKCKKVNQKAIPLCAV